VIVAGFPIVWDCRDFAGAKAAFTISIGIDYGILYGDTVFLFVYHRLRSRSILNGVGDVIRPFRVAHVPTLYLSHPRKLTQPTRKTHASFPSLQPHFLLTPHRQDFPRCKALCSKPPTPMAPRLPSPPSSATVKHEISSAGSSSSSSAGHSGGTCRLPLPYSRDRRLNLVCIFIRRRGRLMFLRGPRNDGLRDHGMRRNWRRRR
jgi:hypothetical protein